MEKILCPKFQFEVRYTHILNFSLIAREILSPYLKLTTGFQIFGQNSLEETIRINFEEDSFHIDVRWDRIILIGERDIERFDDENSQIKVFFEIIDKLQNTNSFGSFTSFLFLIYFVKIQEKVQNKILDEFVSKYCTPEIKNLLNDPNDISITLEKSNYADKQETIMVGLFTNKDLEVHSLMPFKSKELLDIRQKYGLMLQLRIFENITKPTFKTFQKLIESAGVYSKLLETL